MSNQNKSDLDETASTISSIPADYEAETLASITEYITAQQSASESTEQPTVDKNLVNAIVAALEQQKRRRATNNQKRKKNMWQQTSAQIW